MIRKAWIVALAMLASLAPAQDSSRAAAAMASGDYSSAAAEYKKLTEANPADAGLWEQLGLAYLQGQRYPEAIRALQTALEKGFPAPNGKYNLACAYARSGDKQHALDLLGEIVAQGVAVPRMANDPDLASLRDEPRFQELARKSQLAFHPCLDSQGHPEYRQLDFWAGEWDVFAGPRKVGESHVDKILNDCVLLENWSGGGGMQGKSFNKYNPALKKWEQFWVSDTGTTTHYTGELVEGEMRFAAENAGGAPMRLTFTPLPGGRVRQHSQTSKDGGKTWITQYDFTYVKKSDAGAGK